MKHKLSSHRVNAKAMSLNRINLVVLLLLLCLVVSVGVIGAQDNATPQGGADSLDTVAGATPIPLPTQAARSAPVQVISGENARVNLFFANIAQGTVQLAQVAGENVASATTSWLNHLIDFFPVEDEGLFGLLSVGMEQTPRRDYPLVITVVFTDGSRETISTPIEIVLGGFIRQEVLLPPDKAYLLDAETERAELARLESIFVQNSSERMWDDTGFGLPISAALTSPFGAFRVFNSTLNTRHTGWDIRCTIGTPVLASAAGRVVFAGTLPIRGNHVIIDHGLGVYSGYSHFSVVNVTRGQMVTKGQVIGMAGSTGRTSGPHFHWEIAVNGEWIDPVEFLRMWMP
ncbi:MAG: M23 family metallopeptidase [Anaerolineae bacterium]|nr:M23 family metallopeptidase [Anaerolineae bacterium]